MLPPIDRRLCRYCKRSAVCLPLPDTELGRFQVVSDASLAAQTDTVSVWCHRGHGALTGTQVFQAPRVLALRVRARLYSGLQRRPEC